VSVTTATSVEIQFSVDPVTEHVLEDLGGAHRPVSNEKHMPRDFETRDFASTEIDDLAL
jgi:hypothetical protein